MTGSSSGIFDRSAIKPLSGRRGVAYLFILGICLLLTIIGIALITTSQTRLRMASAENDIAEASVLAESALEHALTVLATNPNWRTTYLQGVETSQIAQGRGTLSFKLVDEIDGVLANDPTQPVRAYGIGRIGSTTRIYSVKLTPYGPALDLLKTVCHSGGNTAISAVVTATGGPISANGTLTVNSSTTVNGDIEAPAVSNLGMVTGAVKTVPVKQMPSSTIFDIYLGRATQIPFSSITNGTITLTVLSPAANPYGATNPNGIYYIRVPSNGTLTIRQARLVATLLVDLDPGGKFTTSNAWLMEPPSSDQPALLVRAGGGSTTVDLNGFSNPLSEASTLVNFNPPGTPYPWIGGTSDSDVTDTYPAEFHGIAHVAGSAQTVSIGSNFTTKGCIIVEGAAALGSNINLQLDSAIYAKPPTGYTAAGQMLPVTGTWRWESLP